MKHSFCTLDEEEVANNDLFQRWFSFRDYVLIETSLLQKKHCFRMHNEEEAWNNHLFERLSSFWYRVAVKF